VDEGGCRVIACLNRREEMLHKDYVDIGKKGKADQGKENRP